MEKQKANMKIRLAARSLGVYQWEIAEALGISEAKLTRMLRIELPPKKAAEIMTALSTIAGRDAWASLGEEVRFK